MTTARGIADDDELAARVREAVAARRNVTERRMFGGLAWMVNGNLACAVMTDGLVVRLEPAEAEAARRGPHARPFGRTGQRPMSGFVLVEADAVADDAALGAWVAAGMDRAASLPPK